MRHLPLLVLVPLLLAVSLTAQAGRDQQERRPGISGELHQAGSELVLELSNPTAVESRLQIIVSLGTELEMKEAGRGDIALGPEESASWRLRGLATGGVPAAFYILSVFREDMTGRRLLFYRHAPLRPLGEPAPPAELRMVAPARRTTPAAAVANGAETAPVQRYENHVPSAGVQLQAQLLAGTGDPPVPILSFDLFAERSISNASLEITLGGFRAVKPLSIGRQSMIQFELPADFDDGEREPVVHYRLSSRERRVLLEGDLALAGLMASDEVTLRDLQFDQAAYVPGSTAQVTLQLEGRPRHGFTIEISLRDEQGQIIHRDQRSITAEMSDSSISFNLPLPAGLKGLVALEYRLLDHRRERLFDAGERDLPLKER